MESLLEEGRRVRRWDCGAELRIMHAPGENSLPLDGEITAVERALCALKVVRACAGVMLARQCL